MRPNRPITETPAALFFDDDLPIFVNRVAESFRLPEHTHEFIEISLIAEGEGEHYIDGEHFQVFQGDLFYIPIGVSHVFRPRSTDSSRPLIVYNCIFTPDCMASLLALFVREPDMRAHYRALEQERRWLALRDKEGEALHMMRRLHREAVERAPGYSAGLHAGLIELLLLAFRLHLGEGRTRDASARADVAGLLADIDRSCAHPVRAEEAAKRLGVSPRQLHRLVRQTAGMPLTAYVQDARIRMSCRLLGTTRDKIAAIALAVGYQDVKFFNRLFKKKTGLTPREYRSRSAIMSE